MKAVAIALLVFTFAPFAHAQTASSSAATQVVEKAKTISIESENIGTVAGTNIAQNEETLSALILSGPDTGKTVSVEDDYASATVGELFFVTHTVDTSQGINTYTVQEPDRLMPLAILLGVFVLAVILIGGWTGLRGLLALAASLLFIVYALLPGISLGYDPVVVAVAVASLIVLIGSYLTHGINRTTSAAVFGMVLTVAVTALIAHFAIVATALTGNGDENAVFLSQTMGGQINLVGLLLGGMLIGILGILYDAAISQAVAVEELLRATPTASRTHLFSRAMRIGREHIGALVNTLAIAYVGASLPLLLLFQSYGGESFLATVNREIFATEIVRAVVGSLGIVLAVPVTTLVAIFLLTRKSGSGAIVEDHGNHNA